MKIFEITDNQHERQIAKEESYKLREKINRITHNRVKIPWLFNYWKTTGFEVQIDKDSNTSLLIERYQQSFPTVNLKSLRYIPQPLSDIIHRKLKTFFFNPTALGDYNNDTHFLLTEYCCVDYKIRKIYNPEIVKFDEFLKNNAEKPPKVWNTIIEDCKNAIVKENYSKSFKSDIRNSFSTKWQYKYWNGNGWSIPIPISKKTLSTNDHTFTTMMLTLDIDLTNFSLTVTGPEGEATLDSFGSFRSANKMSLLLKDILRVFCAAPVKFGFFAEKKQKWYLTRSGYLHLNPGFYKQVFSDKEIRKYAEPVPYNFLRKINSSK